MSGLTVLGFILAGAVCALAARDHRSALAARRSLLDRCIRVLDAAELRHGGDGFPRLTGRHRGQRVCLELIPDTMVMRRLPQLWASLTIRDDMGDVPGLAILARPAGYEFYSLTACLEEALSTPAALPSEVLARGSDARAESLLQQVAPALAAILADARVKEIAVTKRGLRLIWQVGEGRRGEHLLLRQAVFDSADVHAGDLLKRLGELAMLRDAVEANSRRLAA